MVCYPLFSHVPPSWFPLPFKIFFFKVKFCSGLFLKNPNMSPVHPPLSPPFPFGKPSTPTPKTTKKSKFFPPFFSTMCPFFYLSSVQPAFPLFNQVEGPSSPSLGRALVRSLDTTQKKKTKKTNKKKTIYLSFFFLIPWIFGSPPKK